MHNSVLYTVQSHIKSVNWMSWTNHFHEGICNIALLTENLFIIIILNNSENWTLKRMNHIHVRICCTTVYVYTGSVKKNSQWETYKVRKRGLSAFTPERAPADPQQLPPLIRYSVNFPEHHQKLINEGSLLRAARSNRFYNNPKRISLDRLAFLFLHSHIRV